MVVVLVVVRGGRMRKAAVGLKDVTGNGRQRWVLTGKAHMTRRVAAASAKPMRGGAEASVEHASTTAPSSREAARPRSRVDLGSRAALALVYSAES